jgi:hypothetical protein
MPRKGAVRMRMMRVALSSDSEGSKYRADTVTDNENEAANDNETEALTGNETDAGGSAAISGSGAKSKWTDRHPNMVSTSHQRFTVVDTKSALPVELL